ncbi:MAG: flavodoxin family protein, partial [Muribaculaceae bacterium]|nr:flavodoxin family protein [Muribaculaceae bacterium]
MKVLGINGSARKGWNTQTLVKKALEGAASLGAETELIDLYAEPLKGCLECFACKRKGNKTGGVCAIRDNMRPLLEKAHDADVLIIGSPNFFGYPSAMTRAFIERFLYPLTSYQIENGERVRLLGDRIIPAGLIFTMNACKEAYDMMGY